MNDIDADKAGEPSTDSTVEPPEQATIPAPPEPLVAEKERVFAGTGLVWGLVVGVLLAVVIVILIAQNTHSTTVEFLAWDYSTPLIVPILAVRVVGVVLDELIGLAYRSRRRRTLRDRELLKRLQTKSDAEREEPQS
jgi:uncharacterized integral membrane protein